MKTEPTRTGACWECLQKHLLKAEGYAEELREDASRAWEKRQLLKNLMLAEDHASALGDEAARAAIRAARIAAETGAFDDAARLYDRLYDAGCGCRKKQTDFPSSPSSPVEQTEEHGEHGESAAGEF